MIAVHSGEKVLSVNAAYLRAYSQDNAVKVSPVDAAFFAIAQERGEFLARADIEDDPGFKQIIPYALIACGNHVFLTTRRAAQSEARLRNMYSLGIGGHINASDAGADISVIESGLLREVNEEVLLDAQNIRSIESVAILSDNSTDVGRCHIGVVYRITLHAMRCGINEPDKLSGSWVDAAGLRAAYPQMETWSQIIVDRHLLGWRDSYMV